jgi:hypothetical protein
VPTASGAAGFDVVLLPTTGVGHTCSAVRDPDEYPQPLVSAKVSVHSLKVVSKKTLTA